METLKIKRILQFHHFLLQALLSLQYGRRSCVTLWVWGAQFWRFNANCLKVTVAWDDASNFWRLISEHLMEMISECFLSKIGCSRSFVTQAENYDVPIEEGRHAPVFSNGYADG